MAGSTPEIDAGTIASLLAALALFAASVLLSFGLLPAGASPRSRVLFVWHAFDALIHAVFEGSFLYHCFASYVQLVAPPSHVSRAHLVLTPPGVHFLAQPTRLYGAAYAAGPSARLWQEYAKADRRWGGVDLTVVSLETLTVLLGAPIAAWIVYLLARGHGDVATAKGRGARMSGKLSFWLIVLATAELYGGFMTFAPEWLSGSPNLDTSNWMYLWLYLVFFNVLWVFLPVYSLYNAYVSLTSAAPLAAEKKKQ